VLAGNLLDVMLGKLDSLLKKLCFYSTTARVNTYSNTYLQYLAFALAVALTLCVEFFIATVCI